MDLPAFPVPLALAQRQFLRLAAPRGVCLTVRRGTLWITLDGRPDDIELHAGDRYRFADDPRLPPALIGALGGVAEFCAARPDAQRAPAADRGGDRLAAA
jgi:hypothetical protein